MTRIPIQIDSKPTYALLPSLERLLTLRRLLPGGLYQEEWDALVQLAAEAYKAVPAEHPFVKAAFTPDTCERLALYIAGWLENRNGAELKPAIEAMKVTDYRNLLEELELILRHGGKPPNWA